VYILNTLLQTVDRRAYLDNPDTVNQLHIICIEVVTEVMTVNEVFQVISVRSELLGTQDRTLRHRTVNRMGTRLLQTCC
jgi:hypothetical protein